MTSLRFKPLHVTNQLSIANNKRQVQAYKPGSVQGFPLDDHSSGAVVTNSLKQPTRTPCVNPGAKSVCSYLVLLQAGFAMPNLLPNTRCALTTPFHPYLLPGGLLSVALSLDVENHTRRTLSGTLLTWSPDFPPANASDHPTYTYQT